MAERIFHSVCNSKDSKKVRFELIYIPHFKGMSLVYILQLRVHNQTLWLNGSSYSGSPGLRYQPSDWLSRLRFCVVFLSLSKQMPG
jgi:hypothetical protein